MNENNSPSDAENQEEAEELNPELLEESALSEDPDDTHSADTLDSAMREKDSLPSEVSELIRAARAWRFDHGTWEALVAAIDQLPPDLV